MNVELGHVEVEKARARKRSVGRGGKVLVTRAHADDQVRFERHPVGARRARGADRAQIQRPVIGQRALAGLGLGDRNTVSGDKAQQGLVGLAVVHAAAGDDERRPAGADPLGRLGEESPIRAHARNRPHAGLEEAGGIVVGFRLDVLRQAQRDRAGVGGRGQHAHRVRQRIDQLVGPIDAIPVAGDGAEAIVDGHVLRGRMLELLEYGGGVAVGKDVPGQEQNGETIDRGQRRAGDHVGRPRPDRRGAGPGLEAILVLGEGHRGVDLSLLVAREIVRQFPALQSLPHAGHVAVSEDAPHAGEKWAFPAVAAHALEGQVFDQGLSHRQTHRFTSPREPADRGLPIRL